MGGERVPEAIPHASPGDGGAGVDEAVPEAGVGKRGRGQALVVRVEGAVTEHSPKKIKYRREAELMQEEVGALQVLNLERNDFREAGLLQILAALESNSTLRELRTRMPSQTTPSAG